MTLAARIVERIHRLGPLPFSAVVDAALYDPDAGFYETSVGAGRRGEFITSPEVGPLFAAVVARALDRWWRDLGEPDPFVVVEAAAGSGALARDVLAARPACAPALRYVLVDRAARQRERQAGVLALEPPAFVLGPVASAAAGDEDGPRPQAGTGPLVCALDHLPAVRVAGVVLANELLDNLPFDLLERRGDRWHEVRVGERDGRLVELLVPAAAVDGELAAVLAPEAGDGARIPLQREAQDWLRQALQVVERGRVVVVDYADTTPSLAARPWPEWVRTYRGHGRGAHPLEALGEQDVTVEVAVDQLARVAPLAADQPQAEFLRDHGLEELVTAARAEWSERAHVGDLQALRARSRVSEAQALTDPRGLGGFRVLQWVTGGDRRRDP